MIYWEVLRIVLTDIGKNRNDMAYNFGLIMDQILYGAYADYL